MTPADPTVRVKDAEAEEGLGHARRLFRACAGSIAESLCFQGFEAELAGLPGRYGPPGGLLLSAMNDDHPVGCVALRGLDDFTCEMKRLYVITGYRGQQLGKRLIEELVLRAAELGYRRMVL